MKREEKRRTQSTVMSKEVTSKKGRKKEGRRTGSQSLEKEIDIFR